MTTDRKTGPWHNAPNMLCMRMRRRVDLSRGSRAIGAPTTSWRWVPLNRGRRRRGHPWAGNRPKAAGDIVAADNAAVSHEATWTSSTADWALRSAFPRRKESIEGCPELGRDRHAFLHQLVPCPSDRDEPKVHPGDSDHRPRSLGWRRPSSSPVGETNRLGNRRKPPAEFPAPAPPALPWHDRHAIPSRPSACPSLEFRDWLRRCPHIAPIARPSRRHSLLVAVEGSSHRLGHGSDIQQKWPPRPPSLRRPVRRRVPDPSEKGRSSNRQQMGCCRDHRLTRIGQYGDGRQNAISAPVEGPEYRREPGSPGMTNILERRASIFTPHSTSKLRT